MIEQQLEKKFCDKFSTILDGMGIQVIGTLQTVGQEYSALNFAEEEVGTKGILVVKCQPRAYDSAMVPTATFGVTVALTIRAEQDKDGSTYCEAMESILAEMTRLHKCLQDVHDDYDVEGIEITGFLLSNGDTTIDTSSKTYFYTHGVTVYAVIQ